VLGLVLGLAVGAGVTYLWSRSTSGDAVADPPASPTASTGTATGTPSNMLSAAELGQIADRAFAGAQPAGTVSAAHALALAWPADLVGSPRVVRNHTDGSLPAGTYTMMVYCAGAGQVFVVLRVGDGLDQGVVTCSVTPSPSAFTVTSPGGSADFGLVALGGGTVVASYQVRRG